LVPRAFGESGACAVCEADCGDVADGDLVWGDAHDGAICGVEGGEEEVGAAFADVEDDIEFGDAGGEGAWDGGEGVEEDAGDEDVGEGGD